MSGTAVANARIPLCVLGLQPGGKNVVSLKANSKLTAARCLLQSDNDIAAGGSAAVQAGAVRSVGSATGSIAPPPVTDAPAIADPFAALAIDIPTKCTDNGITLQSGTVSMNPGVHCGDVKLQGSAALVLNPGEHYFLKGQFNLADTAQVTGSDVVLIFQGNWQLNAHDSAAVSLSGRQSGPYAGFVLVTARDFKGKLAISTDHARQLHGTVYLPSATLEVTGTGNAVADQSPWTVVVANALTTDGSANLVINSNYSGSSVPVPAGVGTSGPAHLAQ